MKAPNANTEKNATLNPQTKEDEGFERHSWEDIVALNAKLKRDGGFECQNWEMMVALNAKLKTWWLWKPKREEMVALNSQTEKRMVALNAETKNW